MSRGLGPVQKQILAVLAQGIEGEFAALETTYLKVKVGGDRSNLRRAIRGLLARDLIEERTENGRCYYGLNLWGWISAVPLDPATAPSPFDPLTLSLKRDTPRMQINNALGNYPFTARKLSR
jgi:hypothetical protein